MPILPQETFIVSGMYNASPGSPASPTTGDSYICSVASGSWIINNIYVYDNTSGNVWMEYQPKAGNIVHRLSDTTELYYDGINWVEFAGSSAAGSGGLWTGVPNGIYRNGRVMVGSAWVSPNHDLQVCTSALSSSIHMSNGNFGALTLYCKDMWNVIDYDPYLDGNEFAFDRAGTRYISIKNNGYIHIGDSSAPAEKLQITEGNIRLFRDDGFPPYINFYEGDIGAYWTIGAEYDNDCAFRVSQGTGINNPMFEVHSNASGRISGSFCIGKLTPPNYNLDIDGTQIGLYNTCVIRYGSNVLTFGDTDGSGFDTRIFSDSSYIRMDIGGNDHIRMSSNNIRFNNQYTFPSTDGSINEVLGTNGVGQLGWYTASSLSLWKQHSTTIYYNSGNVGIGVYPESIWINPPGKLTIGEFLNTTTLGNNSILLSHDGEDCFLETNSGDMAEGFISRGNNYDAGIIKEIASGRPMFRGIIGLHIFTESETLPMVFRVSSNVAIRISGATPKITFNESYVFPTTDGGSGQALKTNGNGQLLWDNTSKGIIEKCGINIDGGGGIIPSGIKGDSYIPYDCEIEKIILTATPSGSIYIDIWKDNINNFPPTQVDSIVGTTFANVSSNSSISIVSSNNTLTGWTTSISDGDILRYYVSACTTIDRCSLTMRLRRT